MVSNKLDPDQVKAPKRKWRWRLIFSGLLAGFVAVAAYLEPDEEDLLELCRTQGMPVIYRTVVADGYYHGDTDDCWGCWNNLENTDYKFIEFSIGRERAWGPIGEPGIYRVSKIPSNSPQCDEKLTSFQNKTFTGQRELGFGELCFRVEKFESRRARYGYYYKRLGLIYESPITGSAIGSQRMSYVDHGTGQVLAESTNYSLRKYPRIQLSSFVSSKHCNTFMDELGARDQRKQTIIVPIKEMMK